MLTKEQRALKKAQKHEEAQNAFKTAFQAALQKKLADMPQMFCGVDLKDELEDRRPFLIDDSRVLETDEAQRGFMLGVDHTLELVYKLCDTVPAEWHKI